MERITVRAGCVFFWSLVIVSLIIGNNAGVTAAIVMLRYTLAPIMKYEV